MGSFWIIQPLIVRLFFLALFMVGMIAMLRFTILAWRLYGSPRKRFFPATILTGGVDANILARSALANRLSLEDLEKHPNPKLLGDGVSGEASLRLLRVAESRFVYLWESCRSDITSTKRACVLALLLSFTMVASGAYPTYFLCYNNSRYSGSYCLIVTGERLLDDLWLGLTLCVILYALSSHFERALAQRMTSWRYFSARLTIEQPPK